MYSRYRQARHRTVTAEHRTDHANRRIRVVYSRLRRGKLLGSGWSIPESWGRWSDGAEAVLILRFADVSRGADFHLSLAPFVMPGHDQRVEVSANGNAVARWRFTTPDARDVSFHIPVAYVRPDGIVRLTFSLPDAASPRSFGLSVDARQLAFRLIACGLTWNSSWKGPSLGQDKSTSDSSSSWPNCYGHPRLCRGAAFKTWMHATSPVHDGPIKSHTAPTRASLPSLFWPLPRRHCEDVQVPASTSTRQTPSSFRLAIQAATCCS